MAERRFGWACAGARFQIEGRESPGLQALQTRLSGFAAQTPAAWWIRVPELESPVWAEPIPGQGDPQRLLPTVERTEEGYRVFDSEASGVLQQRTLQIAPGASFWFVDFCLRWLLALDLEMRGGVLLHGVGLRHQEQAALFIGPSGAGKSTLGKWAPQAGIQLLSDELLAVNREGQVWGTPWNLGFARSASLRLLGTLGWDSQPRLSSLTPSEWLRVAVDNILLPTPHSKPMALAVLTQLAQSVPTAQFFFPPSAQAGAALAQALGGDGSLP